MIAANYKTIDKETKDFCSTVANLIKQRHSLLITSEMLQEFQEGPHQKKTKTKMNPENEEAFTNTTNPTPPTYVPPPTPDYKPNPTPTYGRDDGYGHKDDVNGYGHDDHDDGHGHNDHDCYYGKSGKGGKGSKGGHYDDDDYYYGKSGKGSKGGHYDHDDGQHSGGYSKYSGDISSGSGGGGDDHDHGHYYGKSGKGSYGSKSSKGGHYDGKSGKGSKGGHYDHDDPKKPHLATVKTNGDTKQAIDTLDQRISPTATDHVNQSAITSNLFASSKLSMDTLGTFYHCSTLTDRKSEMFCLPFSIEYNNVHSTANRKIQEKDNAADMMRPSIMALRCEEEEESSLMNKHAYSMPCCQLVGGGSEHAMDSLHSTHSTEEAEVQNSKVSYEFDDLSVDDSVVLGELSSECSDIEEDNFSFLWEANIDLHRP
jgi:hypothetical protein